MHRLVRISPFDQAARRHTSFASLFVNPKFDEDIEVVINDKDLRVDTYRATGAAASTSTPRIPPCALRTCPAESWCSARTAVAASKSRRSHAGAALSLVRDGAGQTQSQTKELEANKQDISFGSQIRNYVLAPYRL